MKDDGGKPPTFNVKVFGEFYDAVRRVALARDITISQAIDAFALPVMKRELAKVVRAEYAELGEAGA
jgi:hypothetical protein